MAHEHSEVARPSLSRRAAATAALLCFAAAMVVGIWSLVDDPGTLLIVIPAFVITGLAVGSALVNRGLRRLLGTAVAAVALVVLVLALDVAGITTAIIVIILIAASGAATRTAFGRHRPSGVAVGPARHGVLIVNPRSGGGAAERHHLVDEARQRGIATITLTPGDDLRALAEDAVAGGADVIGMAGGDGSQALVADVARRHDVAFVCIPAGTRNHFAADLGLDRSDVAGALEGFITAVERRIDLGEVDGRVFVNNASLGIYAEIVQSDDYRNSKIGTATEMLPDLLGPRATPPDLRFTGPDGELTPTADVLLVSNNAYQLRSLGGLGTRPKLDGGELGVVTVLVDRAHDVPALMALESAGALERFRGFHRWTTPTLRVDSTGPVNIGIDGEAMQLDPPLEFRCLPVALRVRVPPHAPGVPPTRPGMLGTLPALVRIVAGHSPR
ncbi:diacylglycerol/lipid kinase family protein [Frankia sp. Cas3]|uniref:diacylglycerol/lipid kinase family protein n=1 Tax=Frankia sp. Cas3 TaxID=3073926 RepID=UPI002AD4063B|nr:diacylglycerol kinase family protein [Frankia sp. Cas3]